MIKYLTIILILTGCSKIDVPRKAETISKKQAPIKFTSGTLIMTPEKCKIEFPCFLFLGNNSYTGPPTDSSALGRGWYWIGPNTTQYRVGYRSAVRGKFTKEDSLLIFPCDIIITE